MPRRPSVVALLLVLPACPTQISPSLEVHRIILFMRCCRVHVAHCMNVTRPLIARRYLELRHHPWLKVGQVGAYTACKA